MKKSEHRFQNKLLVALSEIGALAWRNVVGTFHPYKQPDVVLRAGVEGQADVFCLYEGRFYSIELKASTGRKRKGQVAWAAAVERAGGHARFAKLDGSDDEDIDVAVMKVVAWVVHEASPRAEARRPEES